MRAATKKSLQEWAWLSVLFVILASIYTHPGVGFLLGGAIAAGYAALIQACIARNPDGDGR